MERIIIVGTDTPLQKTLLQLDSYTNLQFNAIYTEPGRNSEVDLLCEKNHLPVRNINSLAQYPNNGQRSELECDWLLCVNSTIIFPKAVLEAPHCGALNMHPGRLPDYAGLHTHQWAIRNGERTFGATLHWMESSVDTGPIAYAAEFAIANNETGLSLFVKCLKAGSDLVGQALRDIDQQNPISKRPQDMSKRKLYRHRDAMNGQIDWKQNAEKIERFVRAADYGPLRCPTYRPSTFTSCGLLFIKKTALLDIECEKPSGTVVHISAEGIDVACGNNSCLRVLAISQNSKALKQHDLAKSGIQIGEHWSDAAHDKNQIET